MKLFTKEIEQRLIKNFKANEKDGELDFKVVCKLFNPTGIGTWYLTELDPDTNIAHALCCLHESECGPVSIQELKELVIGANAIFEANGEEKKIFEEERQVLAWARESVVTEKDIEKGDILNKQNVWVKRPGPGNEFIPAKDYTKVLGKTALKEIKKDTQIKWQDISD